MNKKDKEKFENSGYVTFKNVINKNELFKLKTTIKNLILESVSRLDSGFQEEFNSHKMKGFEVLHKGMIMLFNKSPKYMQYVVDAANNSTSLYKLCSGNSVTNHASYLLGLNSDENLNINQCRLRLDLPEHFNENKKKVHLNYHQESGYFNVNVCQESGIVAWIPLFDCGENEGALRILPNSNKEGRIEHECHFEDPEKKRQKRATVPQKISEKYEDIALTALENDLTFQHFNLIHRSGDNKSKEYVRYTIVSRYSNLLSKKFTPLSWT